MSALDVVLAGKHSGSSHAAAASQPEWMPLAKKVAALERPASDAHPNSLAVSNWFQFVDDVVPAEAAAEASDAASAWASVWPPE